MRPDRHRYPDHQYVPDTFWLIVAVVLFAACGLVWLIGQVAAIVFGPHHQHLPVRLVDMLGVLLRLPGTWDDPAKAWPPTWPLLPGPVGMYAAAISPSGCPHSPMGCWFGFSPRAVACASSAAPWASWWRCRLLVVGPRRGRIILGRRDRIRDRLLGRLYLAVEQCHSVLAFGPPGSFKTHGLVIPAILEWQGNLVTTSIKPDVLRATCAHRANLGPSGSTTPSAWPASPAPDGRHSPTAPPTRRQADRPHAGRRRRHPRASGRGRQLLATPGRQLLSVLLFAAAGTGRSMADVARWVDVQDVDDVAQALMEIGNQQALDAWAACTSRPDNTMGSVYGTAETLLDVYGDPTIAASADGCDLDIDQLLTGANNTLYLYAPASEQERLRPLFELLVSVVIYKAEQLAATQPDGMLDPGCSCAWTRRELRGHQEAPPARHHRKRPGHPVADHLARRSPAPAPLRPPRRHRPERPPGQAAPVRAGRPGLPRAGQQAGRRRGRAPDLRDDRWGWPRVVDRVDGLPAPVAAGGAAAAQAARALLVYGHLPPVRIRLRPWFRSRRLVTLAMAVDAAVPHPAMQVDDPRSR